MAGYSEFISFSKFKYLDKEDLKLANNYICLQLNNPSIGYKYYYDVFIRDKMFYGFAKKSVCKIRRGTMRRKSCKLFRR